MSIQISPSEAQISRGIVLRFLQASFSPVPTAERAGEKPGARLRNEVSASAEETTSFYLTSCSVNNHETLKSEHSESEANSIILPRIYTPHSTFPLPYLLILTRSP